MDHDVKVFVSRQTSRESIQKLLDLLEPKYIPSFVRNETVRHLNIVLGVLNMRGAPPERKEQCIVALYHFQKSTHQMKYIPVAQRELAKELIISELMEAFGDAASLDKIFESLKLETDEESQKRLIFRKFTVLGDISPEIRKAFLSSGVCQLSVSPSLHTVTLFGSLDEKTFWETMDAKLKGESNHLREIVRYYGGVTSVPFVEETTLSGARFPFEILDDENRALIPSPIENSEGSIGGFLRVGDAVYAVTAAHVVSSQPEILDHHFIYRGLRNSTYRDVAFLKVKPGIYCNSLATPLDSDIYQEYWAPTLSGLKDVHGIFFPPEHFPPGTEVEKVGMGSGVTKGFLLDGMAETVFHSSGREEDGEVKKGMVAVRWLPNRPFTIGNDSGSVYYANYGCVRLPIAIHCGSAPFRDSHPKAGFWLMKRYHTFTTEPASFGTRLRDAFEWWESIHEFEAPVEWLPISR